MAFGALAAALAAGGGRIRRSTPKGKGKRRKPRPTSSGPKIGRPPRRPPSGTPPKRRRMGPVEQDRRRRMEKDVRSGKRLRTSSTTERAIARSKARRTPGGGYRPGGRGGRSPVSIGLGRATRSWRRGRPSSRTRTTRR